MQYKHFTRESSEQYQPWAKNLRSEAIKSMSKDHNQMLAVDKVGTFSISRQKQLVGFTSYNNIFHYAKGIWNLRPQNIDYRLPWQNLTEEKRYLYFYKDLIGKGVYGFHIHQNYNRVFIFNVSVRSFYYKQIMKLIYLYLHVSALVA